MQMLDVFIPGELPGLNEIIGANRRNRFAGAKQKHQHTAAIAAQLAGVPPVTARCDWSFTWVCANKRRDPDNVASACKFVFDALQAAGIITNDGWAQVASITHAFEVGAPVGVTVQADAIQ